VGLGDREALRLKLKKNRYENQFTSETGAKTVVAHQTPR
jgi:hypothetical protein